jgi:hypothetical protein
MGKSRRGKSRRGYARLLIGLAVLAVLIPLGGLLLVALESAKPQFYGLTPHRLTLNDAELEVWHSLRTVEPEGEETFVQVALLVKNLNPAEGTLEGVLRVDLIDTDNSLRVMYENKENGRRTPVATFREETGALLKREYRNLTVTVHTESFEGAFPLERLYGSEDVTSSPIYFDVSLPIRGEPNGYPFDWYLLYEPIGIDLGPQLIYVSADGEAAPGLPSQLAVAAMPTVSGTSDKVIELLDRDDLRGMSHKELPEPDDAASANLYNAVRYGPGLIALYVDRPARTRTFVLAMALAPLLLFLVVAGRLVQQWRQGEFSSSQPTELPVELAAAFLAILSLRQVLVPNEVQGLTAVDFVLGVQLALFMGLVAVQYALTLLRSPEQPVKASMTEQTGLEPGGGGPTYTEPINAAMAEVAARTGAAVPGPAVRQVVLRDSHNDQASLVEVAVLEVDGTLRIFGQAKRPGKPRFFGSRVTFDEWMYVIPSARLHSLAQALGGDDGDDVLALLASYYQQHGGQLDSVLKRPEVGAEFSNWHL